MKWAIKVPKAPAEILNDLFPFPVFGTKITSLLEPIPCPRIISATFVPNFMHQHLPPWWDREIDESGQLLRPDVRETAHRVWIPLCSYAQHVLGDTSEAPELLESAVKAISRYLDKRNIKLFTSDLSALLSLAFHRSLSRLARKRRRLLPIGGSFELASLLQAPDWSDEVSRRLFLERITHELSLVNRAIMRLRLSGYSWNEIAVITQTNPAAARRTFWRAVRNAQLRLALTRPIAQTVSMTGEESDA